MEQNDEHILADRVDTQPPIFKGCSSSELGALLLVAVAVWIPLSIVVAALIGQVPLALGFMAVGVLGSVFFGAIAFQRIKRNRPDHYYVHAIQRFLHTRRIWMFPFIWRSGLWDVGRR
jgi:conjugative transfer region protein (TIGR03750 family)